MHSPSPSMAASSPPTSDHANASCIGNRTVELMTDPSKSAGRVAPEILAYYEVSDESGRLDTGLGPLERERTRRLIGQFAPPPPGTAIDVGGGPGAHAIWLSGLGYEVHLIDPVAKHVEQAMLAASRDSVKLASASVGDAGSLNHDDDTVDVVVALGPLYHLPDPSDRAGALDEARRVLRPGGVFFGGAISRYTSLVNAIREGLLLDDDFLEVIRGDLDDGVHRNPSTNGDFFTTAYVHEPDELAAEVAAAGFEGVRVLAVEGIGWAADDFPAQWANPLSRERLLGLIERTESDPALIGASIHLLAVARKPRSGV